MTGRQEIIDALLGRLYSSQPHRAPTPRVFNPALAAALALDPAASALLADMALPMAVDAAGPALFRVSEGGTLLLSPALLDKPALLGVTVRWAQEAAFLVREGGATPPAIVAAARHGAALFERLPDEVRAGAPGLFAADAASMREVLGRAFGVEAGEGEAGGELALPVEALLESGGDARILGSPETGVNRYGAAARPRPEAVHFSSSTASSVSDYGFAALDRLRRALLCATLFRGTSPGAAAAALTDAVSQEILALHGLDAAEADVVLAPSGTDTEWLAVLFALAREPRLLNILVAPDETGRSVKIAAAGLYFQEGAFARATKIWRRADIEVAEAGVRDAQGRLLGAAEIEAALARALHAGLSQGRGVLLHALLGSKTGVNAPSPDFVAKLGAPGGRVDVVADSCQGRYEAKALGQLVRAGWMAQISGSKFFTGPPFSGALLLPAIYRERRDGVARLLAEIPDLAETTHWPGFWRDGEPARWFGPLLRWAGALIEAALFAAAPVEQAREAFDAFCKALRAKLASCRHLVALDPPHAESCQGDFAAFAGRSILCFAPEVEGGGVRRRLNLPESERLFRALNADVAPRLAGLSPLEAALARQPMHIGQPVDLTPGAAPPNVILRLVIGARFFSTVAMAGADWRAALDAEIADAARALDKAELLLARWDEL
jgi:NADPH:quinone reductase-like Zn-dependent oxidoreductase